MRTCTAALIALAGLCPIASAIQTTRFEFQVSADGTNWGNAVTVLPGHGVYSRAVLSYIGTNAVLGLGSFQFQPTVANWSSADTLSPFVNNGVGSNTSTPSGALSPAQAADTTSFGRISPFAAVSMNTSQWTRGHYHANPTGDGTNYLRIAQQQVTSWFGGTGNTSGGSGINIKQLNEIGRVASDPAFNPATSNVAIFKFGFVIDPASDKRTLTISTPAEWFGNRNSSTGDREIFWYRSMFEPSGTDRGTPLIIPATVHVVPTPGALLVVGCGVARVLRRRRW